MSDSETNNERVERFYRLLDRIMAQVALGHDPQLLRQQLEVAIMVSPLAGADQAEALARFDAAVALIDQLDKTLARPE